MTSDAGALLLGITDRAIGLVDRFAACFSDGRAADRVVHDVTTLVGQRVFGIALGYEDLIDHDALRHEPVLGVVLGRLEARRPGCAPLAGKSTLNRLEHAPARPQTLRIIGNVLHSNARARKPARCALRHRPSEPCALSPTRACPRRHSQSVRDRNRKERVQRTLCATSIVLRTARMASIHLSATAKSNRPPKGFDSRASLSEARSNRAVRGGRGGLNVACRHTEKHCRSERRTAFERFPSLRSRATCLRLRSGKAGSGPSATAQDRSGPGSSPWPRPR